MPKAQAAIICKKPWNDSHDRALKLLGSLGRRRRRNMLIAIATFALAAAMAGAGYVAWLRADVVAVEAESEGPTVETPGSASSIPDEARSSAEPSTEPSADEQASARKDTAKEAPSGRRWVVFKPTPPNVSISVNGSPLKPYGPDFRRVRLKVGNHTFRFVGAEGCCEERVIRRRIPAGARDFELSVKLRYKPARLYLKGPAPAAATVRITLPGNRRVAGRIREILRIPMRSLQASAQVQISAPGYRAHKSVVQLRAGGDPTEHSFTLEREAETP